MNSFPYDSQQEHFYMLYIYGGHDMKNHKHQTSMLLNLYSIFLLF